MLKKLYKIAKEIRTLSDETYTAITIFLCTISVLVIEMAFLIVGIKLMLRAM